MVLCYTQMLYHLVGQQRKAEDFAKLMYAKYGEKVSSKAAAALKITRNTLRKYLLSAYTAND